MPTPLANTSPWVESTLARLTLDQKLAQLIHTTIRCNATEEDWRKECKGLTPGGVFIYNGPKADFRRISNLVQDQAELPVVISSDAENGPGRLIKDATQWPEMMGMAAGDDLESTALMGESTAVECRGSGVHWTLSPVVDLNLNPHNPITSTRCLGDDPKRVIRHATTLIRSMQGNGLAATAKHFPGDGFDDRDQHICRTVNPLTMEDWWRLSGSTFKAAVDAGCLTVMTGHISLPAWDPGRGRSELDYPPATVSKRLVTDLLRGQLGFDGLVVTDAIGMGGLTSWGPRERCLPEALMAGCDQLLFGEFPFDFPVLQQAIRLGTLTEERVDQCVRKILRLKEVLGLTSRDAARPKPESAADCARFQAGASRAAAKAITLVRDDRQALPLPIAGRKILSIQIRGDDGYRIDAFDGMMAAAGAILTKHNESDMPMFLDDALLASVDAIVIQFAFSPNWMTGRIRLNGRYMRVIGNVLSYRHGKPVVGISFGSPYHLADVPQLSTLINAYGQDEESMRAVLRVLTGEVTATGVSPVALDGHRRIRVDY